MTLDDCQLLAIQYNHTVFGVKNGAECWAGMDEHLHACMHASSLLYHALRPAVRREIKVPVNLLRLPARLGACPYSHLWPTLPLLLQALTSPKPQPTGFLPSQTAVSAAMMAAGAPAGYRLGSDVALACAGVLCALLTCAGGAC